ncbi:MAG: hypothetical protein LBS32_05550 [Clostridiales Family XIII bacterium]|nr:hypothetical protein [Clostridiales Family XIII bacterium]
MMKYRGKCKMGLRAAAFAAMLALSSASLLTGCAEDAASMEADYAMDNVMTRHFYRVAGIPRSEAAPERIRGALLEWAEVGGFRAYSDAYGNLAVERAAAEGFEGRPATILHTRMDMELISEGAAPADTGERGVRLVYESGGEGVRGDGFRGESLRGDGTNIGAAAALGGATAQDVMENAGPGGPLRAIFSLGGAGMEGLDPAWLEGGSLIDLGWNDDGSICLSSPALSVARLSRELAWGPPTGKNAYVLSAAGPAEGYGGKAAPNPIKVVAELLSIAKGEGVVLEIASLSGGASEWEPPRSASAVIALNDYELKRFSSLFKKYEKDFDARYGGEDGAGLLFAQTEMPEQVMSFDDGAAVVSLLYSVSEGPCPLDGEDAENASVSSNLRRLGLDGGSFGADIMLTGASEGVDALCGDIETLAYLCGAQLAREDVVPPWRTPAHSPLASAFAGIFEDMCGGYAAARRAEPSGIGFIAAKNPGLDIISIGASIQREGEIRESVSLRNIGLPASLILEYLEG